MLKPTSNAIPPHKNIKPVTNGSFGTSGSKSPIINVNKIPTPIPTANKPRFKINTFQKGAAFLFCSPFIKIEASAPFSINAKRSLFLVEKYK